MSTIEQLEYDNICLKNREESWKKEAEKYRDILRKICQKNYLPDYTGEYRYLLDQMPELLSKHHRHLVNLEHEHYRKMVGFEHQMNAIKEESKKINAAIESRYGEKIDICPECVKVVWNWDEDEPCPLCNDEGIKKE